MELTEDAILKAKGRAKPPALPAVAYGRVFENHAEGRQILEELVGRFGKNPYIKGGHEADRQTAFNAGQLDVINFILARINQAQGESP
jgi:hypothetical protein